jgi:hypothetical protein
MINTLRTSGSERTISDEPHRYLHMQGASTHRYWSRGGSQGRAASICILVIPDSTSLWRRPPRSWISVLLSQFLWILGSRMLALYRKVLDNYRGLVCAHVGCLIWSSRCIAPCEPIFFTAPMNISLHLSECLEDWRINSLHTKQASEEESISTKIPIR